MRGHKARLQSERGGGGGFPNPFGEGSSFPPSREEPQEPPQPRGTRGMFQGQSRIQDAEPEVLLRIPAGTRTLLDTAWLPPAKVVNPIRIGAHPGLSLRDGIKGQDGIRSRGKWRSGAGFVQHMDGISSEDPWFKHHFQKEGCALKAAPVPARAGPHLGHTKGDSGNAPGLRAPAQPHLAKTHGALISPRVWVSTRKFWQNHFPAALWDEAPGRQLHGRGSLHCQPQFTPSGRHSRSHQLTPVVTPVVTPVSVAGAAERGG